jgi:hypothetical protein
MTLVNDMHIKWIYIVDGIHNISNEIGGYGSDCSS